MRDLSPAPPPASLAALEEAGGGGGACPEREFFIDNLLVRIQCTVEMIRWTGLAPWEFEAAPVHIVSLCTLRIVRMLSA